MQSWKPARPARPRRGPGFRAGLGLALALGLAACDLTESELRDAIADHTPHEAYVATLREAGALGSAVGQAWLGAAREALRSPPLVRPPFRERGVLSPERPSAVGYRIPLRTGQELHVEVALADTSADVFIDLFLSTPDTAAPIAHVTSAQDGATSLVHEAAVDGDYLLRIQPELLRGGVYTVTIVADAALAFPIPGRDADAIGSYFGAPRDGGARDHHGIDIFAPRGTPVIAVTDGHVRSVRETPRGGKVVWLRDPERGQSVYYAHLDAQLVESGQSVETGDTLGLVGNTGNARSTPPHLHFGIYRRGRGPINPFPFVHSPDESPVPPAADEALLDTWVRITRDAAALRDGFRDDAPLIRTLEAGSAARVIAIAGSRYRLRLPDGRDGYVADWLVAAADAPIAREAAPRTLAVRARPEPSSVVIDSLAGGASFEVLARYGPLRLVRAGDGRTGWLDASLVNDN
ncbi:MAG: peptidoglycan DD-metalloendopeptidase family protein [Longimicrobiales bacterium]